MTVDSEALTVRLAEVLRSSVNGDGGWGYFRGKASRLEPTCWAALALLEDTATTADHVLAGAALARVVKWQGADGLLTDTPGAPPNIAFNGLATVVAQRALEKHGQDAPHNSGSLEKLLSGIVATKGTREWHSNVNRQNNRLVGWPWNDGTFSWIEPTSWCLLALKTASSPRLLEAAPARIEEAERVLADRCCAPGGWNAGNSNMLGKELPPYVPTTALGLLALQDRRGWPEVARSLGWLTRNRESEVSGIATSMTIVAMAVYGLQVEALKLVLCDWTLRNGIPENAAAAAMVLYALTGGRHGYAAFAL